MAVGSVTVFPLLSSTAVVLHVKRLVRLLISLYPVLLLFLLRFSSIISHSSSTHCSFAMIYPSVCKTLFIKIFLTMGLFALKIPSLNAK